MKKSFVVMLIIAVLLLGSVIGFNMFKQKMIANFLANMPEPEYPVTSAQVTPSEWTSTIQAIGFIEPNQGVILAAEVSGVVKELAFSSGQVVKQGKLLVKLDSKVEEANLRSAMARLPAAEAKFNRHQGLYKNGSVSKEAFDDAQASYNALRADIESLTAAIERRTITAPFAGVVGLRNVFLGQYMQPGMEIVRLDDTSVMRLRLTVPQTDISKIRIGQPIDISVDAFPDTPFSGSISAIEPAVSFQSGLIQVQADIPNNDGMLRSGMFARANIILPTQKNQIIINQTAINFALYGENVFVLREEDGVMRAYQQVIKVGERKGSDAHIIEGLKVGDVIVTSGQIRLSNGSKVRVVENNALTPPAQLPKL